MSTVEDGFDARRLETGRWPEPIRHRQTANAAEVAVGDSGSASAMDLARTGRALADDSMARIVKSYVRRVGLFREHAGAAFL